MNISSLIQKRKSCRAYTHHSVDLEVVRSLLETAKWAPSGVNHQPTKVAILGPETRKKLSKALVEKFDSGAIPNPDYEFCPDAWCEVYKSRRKACGRVLYQSLGVSLEDFEGKKRHKRRNYNFFEAPVGLIIFIEKGMPKGSWLDVGLFIQNFLLAAEDLGLATCAQASFAEYPDVVRDVLDLTEVDIVCGIALGYEDLVHPLNSYRTKREAIDSFTRWYN
jgi:nitroreductase